MNKLLMGAAMAGGLYWASKQPGGVRGVWDRFQGKAQEISDSPDPLGALQDTFAGRKGGRTPERDMMSEHDMTSQPDMMSERDTTVPPTSAF